MRKILRWQRSTALPGRFEILFGMRILILIVINCFKSSLLPPVLRPLRFVWLRGLSRRIQIHQSRKHPQKIRPWTLRRPNRLPKPRLFTKNKSRNNSFKPKNETNPRENRQYSKNPHLIQIQGKFPCCYPNEWDIMQKKIQKKPQLQPEEEKKDNPEILKLKEDVTILSLK